MFTRRGVRRAARGVWLRARRRWYVWAAALVGASAILGWAGPALDWFERRSILELLATALGGLFTVAFYRQSRSTIILPFRNLSGDEGLESFAKGFSELLEVEIHRINRIRSGRGSSEPESVNVPVLSRAVAPGLTTVRELETDSGTGAEGDLGDVGTVDVAGVRLQLGILARSVLRRPSISGSVVRIGDELRVVADYSGRPRLKWSLPFDWRQGEDAADDAERLARNLAYRMVWQTEGQQGGDWKSFAHLIDGLEHYKRYVKHPRLGHLRRAEERFLDAIALYPQFSPAYYNLGVIREERASAFLRQERKDDYEKLMSEATDSYRLTIEIDPDMTQAHLRLAVTLAERAGHDPRISVEDGVGAARTAIAVADRQGVPFPSARIALARFLTTPADAGETLDPARLREAITLCKEAERDFRRLRRWAAGEDDETHAAAAELFQAIRYRGELEAERGRHRRASRAFRKVVRHRDDDALAHAFLGQSLTHRRRWRRAWDQLAAALTRDPLCEAGAVWLAEWLVHRGRIYDAIEVYGYVLSLDPENREALVDAPDDESSTATQVALDQHAEGRGYLDEGHLDQAIERFESAIAAPEGVIPTGMLLAWRLELAQAYAARGEASSESGGGDAGPWYEKAIEVYTEVAEEVDTLEPISLEPPRGRRLGRGHRPHLRLEPPSALDTRARALAGRGEARLNLAVDMPEKDAALEAAREDCREAIRLRPTYPFPQDALARVHHAQGDEDGAIETWRRVAILAPEATADVAMNVGGILLARAGGVQNKRRKTQWLAQAVAEYATALSEDLPADRETLARWALAEALFELGRAEDAVVELERLNDARAPAQSVVLLARSYQAAGRLSEAEGRYRRALEIQAEAFDNASEEEKAEAALALAGVKNWFAYFHAEQGDDLEEGEQLVADALELLEKFPPDDEQTRCDYRGAFLDTRAWLRYRAEDYDASIRDLQAALREVVTLETRRHLALALGAKAEHVVDEAERRRVVAAARRQWEYVEELDPEAASAGRRAPASI